MSKYKMICLIGESGSGKDSVLKELLDSKFSECLHKVVSCTTRPKREGEKDGYTYHYVDKNFFASCVLSGEIIEASTFNHWLYGTHIKDLSVEKINVGIFDPYRLEALLERKDIDLYIFYIKASDKNRLVRQLTRETEPDVDEIIRRFKADKEDFYDLDFPNLHIINNNSLEELKQSPEAIISFIKK